MDHEDDKHCCRKTLRRTWKKCLALNLEEIPCGELEEDVEDKDVEDKQKRKFNPNFSFLKPNFTF